MDLYVFKIIFLKSIDLTCVVLTQAMSHLPPWWTQYVCCAGMGMDVGGVWERGGVRAGGVGQGVGAEGRSGGVGEECAHSCPLPHSSNAMDQRANSRAHTTRVWRVVAASGLPSLAVPWLLCCRVQLQSCSY
jgi:hypothetical protein